MDKPEKQKSHSEELSSHHPSKPQENNQPWSTSENEMNWLKQDTLNEQTELEKKLQETEIAANSVVSLIPLFKDFLAEFNRESVSNSLDTLKTKLADNENENDTLRKKVLEKEDYIQKLSSFIQKEKANTLKTSKLSHSVKSVQSHLQLQIQKKEAENDQLKSYMKSLKAKIAEGKLQLKTYEQQVVTLKQTNEKKKIALKKASKVCKERADSFTANIEDLTSQITEREAKLSEALSALLAWKSHYEKAVEEKTDLEVQVETLKKKITNLLEEQQKKEDPGSDSNKDFLRKLHSSDSDNENIILENEKLKITLANLEEKVISVENERLELQEVEKKQKALVEVYKSQVQKLQKAIEDVKSRYEKLVCEKKIITQTKKSTLEEVEDRQSPPRAFSAEAPGGPGPGHEELPRRPAGPGEPEEAAEAQRGPGRRAPSPGERGALARRLEAALEEGQRKVSEEIEKMTSRERALQTKIFDLESELRKTNEAQDQLVCILDAEPENQ
ncbi:protein BCAP isoform X2 [Macrotis lagotis]|uniref:protein BCAP isoform X2 n=1 Tax=Macrotis lagotis TaxID=92651 RepID=UPI003D69604D